MILQTNSCVLCRINNITKDRSNKINERSVRGKANKSKMGEKLRRSADHVTDLSFPLNDYWKQSQDEPEKLGSLEAMLVPKFAILFPRNSNFSFVRFHLFCR